MEAESAMSSVTRPGRTWLRRISPLVLVVGVATGCVDAAGSGTTSTMVTASTGPASSSWTVTPTQPATTPTSLPPRHKQVYLSVAEAGLTCVELAELGLSYRQVVSYWMGEPDPARLDPDRDQIPCEENHTVSELREAFGDLTGLQVEIRTGYSEESQRRLDRFTATGPAANSGVVCDAGSIWWLPNKNPEHNGGYVIVTFEVTCDDGSGTFEIGFEIHGGETRKNLDTEAGYAVWSVALGTGDYQNLTGGGGTEILGTPEKPGGWHLLIGRLTNSPTNP